jgi:hypothetical protein
MTSITTIGGNTRSTCISNNLLPVNKLLYITPAKCTAGVLMFHKSTIEIEGFLQYNKEIYYTLITRLLQYVQHGGQTKCGAHFER